MRRMIPPEATIVYLDRDPLPIEANPLGIPNAPAPTKFLIRLNISFDMVHVPPTSRRLARREDDTSSFILRMDCEMPLMLCRVLDDRNDWTLRMLPSSSLLVEP